MSAQHDDDRPEPPEVASRLPPRRLSLRVNGARMGDAARPAAETDRVRRVGLLPASRKIGLRVHTSALARNQAAPELEEPATRAVTEPGDVP